GRRSGPRARWPSRVATSDRDCRANPDHWSRLLKAIEREDLIGDLRYETGPARGERAAEVDELIAAWTRQHSKEEVMKVIRPGRHAGADERRLARRARHHADDRA